MITRDSIEQAYSFFHQKWRVYKFSTMEWQRDDIESAIGDYVAMMSPDLYRAIARGNSHYLLAHQDAECFVGALGVLDFDLHYDAVVRVHRGLPQLVGVHRASPRASTLG